LLILPLFPIMDQGQRKEGEYNEEFEIQNSKFKIWGG